MKKATSLLLLFVLSLCPLTMQAQNENDVMLAAEYFRQQDYSKALNLYESLYKKTPSYVFYQNVLQCHLLSEQFDAGERWIKSAIKNNPTDLRYAIDLGTLYLQQGKTKKMQECFEGVLNKIVPNPMQIQSVADAFTQARHFDYALQAFDKGRELLNDPVLFAFNMMPLYEQQKLYTRIAQDLFQLLDRHPQMQNQIKVYLASYMQRDTEAQLQTMAKRMLLKKVQQEPDNRMYGEFFLWFLLEQKEYNAALVQIKAFDKRHADDQGKTMLNFANTTLQNAAFDIAIETFTLLIAKGKDSPTYLPARIGLLDARYRQVEQMQGAAQKERLQLKDAYETALVELGKNNNTVALMQNYAHLLAFRLDDLQAAADILDEILALSNLAPQVQANCKLEMGDILLLGGDVWGASLLYSQVEKAFKQDIIGAEAKFRSAKLSYYIAEFEWAKSQLDILRAATSKLIANDAMELSLLISENADPDSSFNGLALFARSDLAIYQNKLNEADILLDSIAILYLSHPLSDDVLWRKAEIQMLEGNVAAADSLLVQLLDRYPEGMLADDALFKLAENQQKIWKNAAAAIEHYKRLVIDYPQSLYANEARGRYRILSEQQPLP